jgi:hypothetical protein
MPFIFLLLLTFGLVLAVLGAFLIVFSRGKPRIYGTGFLGCGLVVVLALVAAILNGSLLSGQNIVMDIIVPGLIYTIAFAVGAVLALLPFLFAAIRS